MLRFKHLLLVMVVCLFTMSTIQQSAAEVSVGEASKLKSVLTPTGAERSGNKDGSIPEWKGGIIEVPSDYKTFYDFFPNEKPLFSINAKNVGQYSDKLSEGQQALLKKYPDSYLINVYPTHRTFALPQYYYDNTYKNATRAKTENDGETIKDACGGFPFPIPKTGKEAMWNHQVGYSVCETQFRHMRSFVTTGEGRRYFINEATIDMAFPYWYKDVSLDNYDGVFMKNRHDSIGPPIKAGENLLIYQYTDNPRYVSRMWQYLVGQRRVRRLPNAQYDTPNVVTSGVTHFDEIGLYWGSKDRYEWKILGKKEMFIPYNTARHHQAKIEDVFREHHLNPDLLRWELHRVWVIEATLAPKQRHVVPKRIFYLDEDSWVIALADGWDAQGKLWRTGHNLPFMDPTVPTMAGFPICFYNLRTGAWLVDDLLNGPGRRYEANFQKKPNDFFSVNGLAASGIR